MMLTRRGWLRASVCLLAAGAAPRVHAVPAVAISSRRSAPRSLHFGVLAGAERDGRWLLGARLGAEEAASTAKLLGAEVVAHEPVDSATEEAALAQMVGEPVQALVVGAWGGSWREIEDETASQGVLLMDARALRPAGDGCRRHVFRLGIPAPSDADGPSLPIAWHESLQRYGAEQLNRRFHERFGAPMDGAAWTAWFAVKVLVESWLRARSDDAVDVARYLASDAALFDGHKGRPLRFRADHQLEHPLYDVPQGGAAIDAKWSWPAAEAEACTPS